MRLLRFYDTYGRLERVKRQIGSSYFYTDQSYNSLERVDIVKYPGSIAGDTSTAPKADANRLGLVHLGACGSILGLFARGAR